MEQRFRSAFRGFNRRDVQEYIVRADTAHREKTAALERELEALRGERDSLDAALAGLQGEKGALDAEEARVRSSLEESTRTLAHVRGELEETEDQLAAARRELERLQAQVAELEPPAASYQQLKERIAVIELESHKKAQQVVDHANAQALETRQQTRKWLLGVLGQYEKLCDSADKLDEQLREVEGLTGVLLSGDNAAAKLMEALGE